MNWSVAIWVQEREYLCNNTEICLRNLLWKWNEKGKKWKNNEICIEMANSRCPIS